MIRLHIFATEHRSKLMVMMLVVSVVAAICGGKVKIDPRVGW